jgi:hypothetical protein
MKKRVAICFILLTYVAASCGGVLQADCCHSDSGHSTNDHTEHPHSLSKSQTALHLLKHSQEISLDAELTNRKCCCVSSECQEAGQPSHTFSRQIGLSIPNSGLHNVLATLPVLDIPATGSEWRASIPPGSSHIPLTCRSICTTVLLI